MGHIVHDEEVDLLRRSVSCAAIPEWAGWLLDVQSSARRALKYRRGPAEILIVSHEDKGWWNPLASEKGDCFGLVQYLDPGLNFGQVRKTLRQIAGVSPTHHRMDIGQHDRSPAVDLSLADRWARRRVLMPSTEAWIYLAGERCLPEANLRAASTQDCVRADRFGSAWFAHRDHTGYLTGIEACGPDYRDVLRGSEKTLFRFRSRLDADVTCIAVTEAPIDALSLAAIEEGRGDTLYVSTTGGMEPGTIAALGALFHEQVMAWGKLIIATDADASGDHHAKRINDVAVSRGIASARLLPPVGANDWNDVLKSGRRVP